MKIFIILLLFFTNSHAFLFLLLFAGSGHNSKHQQKHTSKYQQEKYTLSFDLGEHKDANIKILNIKEPFTQGMLLKEGNYDIEISKIGYIPKKRTINLNNNLEYKVFFGLDKNYHKNLCDDGNSKSCFNLALAYNNGYDQVEKNFTQATVFYDKGCALNESNSCLNLGVMYFYGEGVFEDIIKSKQFLQKACELGNNDACKNIEQFK